MAGDRVDKAPIAVGARLLLLLFVVFICSRLVFFSAGIRFDDSPLTGFWQYPDPELLRTDLARTTFYMHGQPPLYNLFLGVVLKMFPGQERLAFSLIYKLLGLGLCSGLFLLMCRLGVRVWLSLAVTVAFILSPSSVLYENWLFYTYPVATFLVWAAVALFAFLDSGRLRFGAAFFCLVAATAMTRSLFHLIWVLLITLALILLTRRHRKQIVLAALVPLVVVLSLYVKNLAVFGTFTGSTWLGMNFAKMTTFRLSDAERNNLIERGVISELNLTRPFGDIRAYETYTRKHDRTGVAILDQHKKSIGRERTHTNFNHIAFVEISHLYMRDALVVLKVHPTAYLQSLASAFSFYFFPSSDYEFVEANRSRIGALDTFYNKVVYGQFLSHILPVGAARTGARYTETYAQRVSRVGLWLVVGIAAFGIFGFRRIAGSLSGKPIDEPLVLTLAFAYLTVVYVTVVGNLVEVGENQRFRFTVDPLLVTGLALLAEGLLVRLRGPGRQAHTDHA